MNQNFFINFFYEIFFTYMKMSKNSSAKYYKGNKERLQKNAPEIYQSLSKEEKRYFDNMVVSDTKNSQKIKNKSWLSIEKNITK